MNSDIQELIDIEEETKDYKHENTIEMLRKLQKIADKVEERIKLAGAKYWSIERTMGGTNGQGNSYLIKASIKYHDFVIAKISDHSKFDHDIQLFDWMSKEAMLEEFDVELLKEIVDAERTTS